MSKQPETLFKERVVRRLKEIPGLWVEKIQQVGIRGTPDLLICYRGYFIAWELKTDRGRVEPLQQFKLDEIEKSGGIARIVRPKNLGLHLAELLALTNPSKKRRRNETQSCISSSR